MQELKQKKRRLKFKWINWAIIGISVVAVIFYIFMVDKPSNILKAFSAIKLSWVLMAIGAIVLYWILESGVLHIVIKKLYRPQHFSSSIRTSMVGQFYNCITPFASGGQPMQAYSLVKSGVPLGAAGSALLIKFIVYQFTLTVYSLVLLLIFWNFFAARVSGLATLSAVGFLINFAVMAGLLCIGFAKKFTAKAAAGLIRLLAKLKLVKHPEEKIQSAQEELERFYQGFRLAGKNKAAVLQMIALSAVQLTAFFLIPYFLCVAFGSRGVSPLHVIAAQAFVTMVTSFVPLPGAAGGAEISFVTFFAIFVKGNVLNLSMLLWRILTFYFPIIFGGIFALGCAKDRRAEENTEKTAVV